MTDEEKAALEERKKKTEDERARLYLERLKSQDTISPIVAGVAADAEKATAVADAAGVSTLTPEQITADVKSSVSSYLPANGTVTGTKTRDIQPRSIDPANPSGVPGYPSATSSRVMPDGRTVSGSNETLDRIQKSFENDRLRAQAETARVGQAKNDLAGMGKLIAAREEQASVDRGNAFRSTLAENKETATIAANNLRNQKDTLAMARANWRNIRRELRSGKVVTPALLEQAKMTTRTAYQGIGSTDNVEERKNYFGGGNPYYPWPKKRKTVATVSGISSQGPA